MIYVVRIGQFWSLNVFTFFVGWFVLDRYLVFTDREVFNLAGLWGLFAEKVIFTLPANPMFFLFDFSPTILTLAYALIFICSVPAVLVLQALRDHAPQLFPPASMVPL